MPAEFDITLQDLAKIALGTPQLTHVNIAILHSLIEILLKKLNCENETVSLNAYESKHLENILKTAQVSPMAFNDNNVEKISEKFERLDKLQECVTKMDEKLNKHLQEIQQKSNFNETVINWENWASYGCEHLCTTCDPENEMACSLLKNTDFIKKLLRRMSHPMVERLFHFEEKIQQLDEAFTHFIKRAEAEYLKIQLLEKCMIEIEKLRQITREQQSQFLHTMEEIQDMLDAKLDKIHMPALKKYIRSNFKQIDQSINVLQDKQNCPRAAGIIMEGVRCMACGNKKVCSDVGVQPAAMLPDVSVKPVKLTKYCGRSNDNENNKKTSATAWNLGDSIKIQRLKAMEKDDSQDSPLPKCRKAGEDFELLEGFDGKLYRKG